jgi:Fe-S cluster assembly protein SufD
MTTAIKENPDVYLKSFREFEKRAKGPEWLASLRTEAIEAFAEQGFPTTHNEEWKYTNVAPIARTEFIPAVAAPAQSVAATLKSNPFADLDCPRLAFVNGRFAPELSSLRELPQGAKVTPLTKALAEGERSVEANLARYATFATHPFVALNTAFLEEGALVEIPKGVVAPKPIQLLYLSAGDGSPAISHPRNLILVGPECELTFIETHVGMASGVYFTNAVTEAVVGENSRVDYMKFQHESEAAFHVATLKFHQARNSRAHATTVELGARLAREEASCVLDGEGCEGTLNGLYVLNGQQHADNHTTLDHAKPHCASRELYKGILEGKSTGVFNGKIIVRPDAQKTDSKQSNKNLLLSADAQINTKPQLEIYADDVKCTHGATIGQIDAEALFYMRSRGIGLDEARNLLTVAFANDVIDKILYEPLSERLRKAIAARLARKEA